MVLAVWGNNGNFLNRDQEVLELISNPMCLNINKSGQPAHPLYQKIEATPKPFNI